jgi:hypothetical protein
MPLNAIPLDLDITGLNPDNLIVNEPHSLSNRPTRSIATSLGPFFAPSLILRDGSLTLTRGVDYQIVELHQEATLLYAQEIASVILVINSSVSSDVTATYQALGGYYANNAGPIANLYETVMMDNRPVDWLNVMNKPLEYPPTLHRHLLEDVYGFEPVVDYLERIKRAITLGQVNILLQVLQEFMGGFACKQLPKVLPSNTMVAYDAMLYFLSRKKILSDIWIDTLKCTWRKGDSASFQVDTSGYPVGTLIHWYFYNPNGAVALFGSLRGIIASTGGIVDARVYVPTEALTNNETLYMGVRDDPSQEDFKAVTYKISVQEDIPTTSASGFLLFCNTFPNNKETFVGGFADNPEKRLYYQLRYA